MRYLILIALILAGIVWAFANAEAARFEYGNGQPNVMDDGVVGDTLQQIRYDFSSGRPAQVFDTTAVDTTPAVTTQGTGVQVTVQSGVEMTLNNGITLIQ